ncbi:hypothetical protein, partial [Schumannella sp. 10F1B-5-1]|uniref:hypothetical protein n=1 Tax=Schumannella sp. 10F1B-5-1 TaxID=2590780 RepID=UPI0015E868FA
MADDETNEGSHGADGAGGSSGGSTATGDMGLEALLALVTGVEDSGVAGVLDTLQDGTTGWVTGTPGGPGRDDWSPNLYYGYFHYEEDERIFELINNPEPAQQFNDAFKLLVGNIGKVTSDNMPGLSARRSETASALFANFNQVTGNNVQDITALATSLGAEDSSIRGSAAAALLAQLTSQQKSLEAMHRQLTDDGGVATRLQEVATAVRTFMSSVESTWNAHSTAIADTAGQAKAAVMMDIYKYIEAEDAKWRAAKSGRNGMSIEHAKQVMGAYTWGDRGGMAPEGFTSASGDLRSTSTFGMINRAISQSVRDVMAKAAGEVFTAQQTLETAMRTSLRTFKNMQDPTVAPEDTSADYTGGDDIGGDDIGGGGDGPDWDDIFGDDGPGGDDIGGDGVGGDGPGGDGVSGDGDDVFGDGPGGDGAGGGDFGGSGAGGGDFGGSGAGG